VFLFAAIVIDTARLDALLKGPRLSGATVSAIVLDEGGNIVYSLESDRHVTPASNQKLLTAAFALHTLGSDYRPRTRFWKRPDGLYVDSEGDPMLTHEDLVTARKRLGSYNDSLVRVTQAYNPGIPPTWEFDDLANKYAAPVSAFSVDRNSVELWAIHGSPALKPFTYGLRLARHASPDPWSSSYDPFSRRVDVFGKLPGSDLRLDTLAVPDGAQAASLLLGTRYEPVESAPSGPSDYEIVGHSTIETVRACLPPSDNNLAEGLLMQATARLSTRKEDAYLAASRDMTRFLTLIVGIDPADIHIIDGSGMSRQNFVTTRAVAHLLQWENAQPESSLWVSALAPSGTGTLSGRLKGVDFRGKTGTLNMVSAISGYLQTKAGQHLTISLIFNEFTIPDWEVHQIQDAFIRVLVDSAP